MSLMDGMMKSFIDRMSIEQKQEMMLKMMPMMMKDVNMAETMLKMMPQMMDNISMLDILNVLKKLFPSILKGVTSFAELMAKWNEIFPKMMKQMPDHMEKMMPFMQIMMPMMMGKMMPVMLSEENIVKMEQFPDKMAPKMLDNENVRKYMPVMMSIMVPKCLEHLVPLMEDGRKEEFKGKMVSILENA